MDINNMKNYITVNRVMVPDLPDPTTLPTISIADIRTRRFSIIDRYERLWISII